MLRLTGGGRVYRDQSYAPLFKASVLDMADDRFLCNRFQGHGLPPPAARPAGLVPSPSPLGFRNDIPAHATLRSRSSGRCHRRSIELPARQLF